MLRLSVDQRRAVEKERTPILIQDQDSGRHFVLLEVVTGPADFAGVRAMVIGLPAIGEGDDEECALLAFVVALKAHLNIPAA